MSIENQNPITIAGFVNRSRILNVKQELEDAGPVITVNRENAPVDAEGKRVMPSQIKEGTLDLMTFGPKTFTAAGVSATGFQIVSLVKAVMDGECADWFTPPEA